MGYVFQRFSCIPQNRRAYALRSPLFRKLRGFFRVDEVVLVLIEPAEEFGFAQELADGNVAVAVFVHRLEPLGAFDELLHRRVLRVVVLRGEEARQVRQAGAEGYAVHVRDFARVQACRCYFCPTPPSGRRR